MNSKRRTCRTLAVAKVRHAIAHAIAVPRTLLAAMRGRLRGTCTYRHAPAAGTPELNSKKVWR